MIAHKYDFLHYNGLRQEKLNLLTNNGQINPFSNRVIIIDEAHNFISRIVINFPNQIRIQKLKRNEYHYLFSYIVIFYPL